MCDRSLRLFKEMQMQGEIPDEYTFTSTLKACRGLGAFQEGTQIHAFLIIRGCPIPVQNIISGALIDLYAQCGYLFQARKVFDQLETKSVVPWTTLIIGYSQEGNLSEAMDLFRQLKGSRIPIDRFVLSSMISVFADFALAESGKQMHSYAIKTPSGLETSPFGTC
ncbi:unnamed protein product [Fraxinus pennsylvanica]|uniref:Pentatricopeptide repeat-containing protein n=1 Tax=Fraxinus pennsylvanica TaxID=56036 RepID=A0AAD1YYK1_9LAMI|nr:unnamed protein product [Fraxinus pennsylvanica]